MAVNLLGGLYPGLYDYLIKVPEPPILVPSICLTSDVSSRCRATSEVSVCEAERVTSDVEVRQLEPVETETSILVEACRVDVQGRIMYEKLEVKGFVMSDVRVRYQGTGATLPPVVCAEVEVRYLHAAAIDCTSEGVTAEVCAQTLFTSDGVGFCCGSRP